MLKLWLLDRLDEEGWDEYLGFVIRAESETSARRVAVLASGEGRWEDRTVTSCVELTQAGAQGVVLESFHAG